MRITDETGLSGPMSMILRSAKKYLAALFFLTAFISGAQAKNNFPPGVPDLSNDSSYIYITIDSNIADNTSNDELIAHIVDSDGNPVSGVNVNFSWNPGSGEVTVGASTNAMGNAIFHLASKIIGKIAVNAKVGGVSMTHGNPAFATFIAYRPNTAVSTTRLVVVTTGSVANGTATDVVKAIITDSAGNPVKNQTVVFTKASGTANFSTPTTVTTDANGEAYVSMTRTTAGSVGVTATVNGTPIPNGSPATVTFVADAPDVSVPTTYVQVVTTGAIANGTATDSLLAHITDANGNPAPNQTVVFTISSGTATPLTSLTVTTDANGYAPLPLVSTTIGTVNITATVNGTPISGGAPVSVTFVAGPPSTTASGTRLVVVTTGALANGSATNRVKAIVTDATGHLLAGETVTFQIASGIANFTTAVTVTTDVNGEATVSLSSSTPGYVDITANVNGTPITNNSPASVVFVKDPPDPTQPATRLEVVTNGALANGTATNSVRAHVVDANGIPVPGQTIIFTIASGTANPVGSFTMTTDASGNAVLFLNSTTVGNVDVIATVNGSSITNNSPASVQFVIDVPSVTVATTKLVVVTTGAVANGVALNRVKAIITDKNGNLLAGQTVAFTITPGTAQFVGAPQLFTDLNGEAIINILSTVSGPFNITATVNGIDIVNGSPATVVFVAGVPDLTNPLSRITVTKDSVHADGVATDVVKAHLVDAFGNPVPNQSVTFFVASGIATPSSSLTVISDANGDAVLSFFSTTDGQATITAKLNATDDITYGSPATITFVKFPDVSKPATALSVITTNAINDGTAFNVIKAHIVDNNGVAMPGQKVVFTIVSGDGTITTIQPVVTDANGDVLIQIVSNKVGYVAVTAKVEGIDIINGSPAQVRFTADDVWVPKVFTPNGDGTNDVIRPIINGTFKFEFFSIYNRWGNQLFNSTDAGAGWDGRLKGVLQPNETYLWIIGGTDRNNVRVQKRGMFTLVR